MRAFGFIALACGILLGTIGLLMRDAAQPSHPVEGPTEGCIKLCGAAGVAELKDYACRCNSPCGGVTHE